MMRKKYLIVTPSFSILGGVANHYQGLATYWKNDVHHIYYGKRKFIPAAITIVPDLLYFIFKMIFFKYDAVIINPSLRSYQIKRDGIYLIIAKLFRKRVVTFIHGWDQELYNQIKVNPKLFCKVYGKSLFIYVLYSEFKKQLESLPINVPVLLTTTKVKDILLEGYDISHRSGNIETILFLARADKYKGLDITIKTFEILKKTNPKLKLNVCGIGNALEDAIKYVEKNKICDVYFKGHVAGNDIALEFRQADIYILPTQGEGMATSILEAMAFGLPIISRPVGGINDYFVEGEMGYLINSLIPEDFADIIQFLIENNDIVKRIANNNHKYAKTHFFASKVAERIEEDINNMLISQNY